MNIKFEPNCLYYGDCLDIMADFPEKSVDLICLDPPFNSNRKYNNIFKNSGLKTEAQIKAFDDVWHSAGIEIHPYNKSWTVLSKTLHTLQKRLN